MNRMRAKRYEFLRTNGLTVPCAENGKAAQDEITSQQVKPSLIAAVATEHLLEDPHSVDKITPNAAEQKSITALLPTFSLWKAGMLSLL
jgi:hypothetical protein